MIMQVGMIFLQKQETDELIAFANVHREINGNYTAFDAEQCVLAVESSLENLLMWAIGQRVNKWDETVYFFPYGSIGR
jgi:hypothetical protein